MSRLFHPNAEFTRAGNLKDAELIDEDPPAREPRTGKGRRASLAALIREMDPPERGVAFLVAVRDGDIPGRIVDERTRMIAQRMLWDRAYGRPAQLVQVEDSLTRSTAGDELGEAVMHEMSDEGLEAFERAAEELAALAKEHIQ